MARPTKTIVVEEVKQPVVVNRDMLIALAKEMNDVMSLKPAINTKAASKGLSDEDLTAEIKEIAKDLEATDFLPDEDFTPFTADAVVAFEALGILVPKLPTKKVEKDEKGKKVKPATTAKPAGTVKYTRAHAFADAVKANNGTTSLEKLLTDADKLYSDNGGKANLKEAKWYQGTILPGLVALGYASIKDGFIHCRLTKRDADKK